MNNNNLVDLISQTKNYQAHRKKIASIMTKNQASDNKRIGNINAFYSNHDRAKSYNFKAKQDAVQKQNDLILKKIIQVNNRKSNNIGNQRNSSHNNLQNLKKSMQTINRQNQKLAQKLVSTTSNLRQEKLCNTYHKHLQRKERIKKYEFDEQVGLIIPKKMKSLQKIKTTLQPLKYRQTQRYGYYSKRQVQESDEQK